MIRMLLLLEVVLVAFAFAECILAGPDRPQATAEAFLDISVREAGEPRAHDTLARTQGALLTPAP